MDINIVQEILKIREQIARNNGNATELSLILELLKISEEYKELSVSAVDMVDIVRCKDCIYYQEMATGGLCMCGDKKTSYAADFYPKDNDFCSYGERKDGE